MPLSARLSDWAPPALMAWDAVRVMALIGFAWVLAAGLLRLRSSPQSAGLLIVSALLGGLATLLRLAEPPALMALASSAVAALVAIWIAPRRALILASAIASLVALTAIGAAHLAWQSASQRAHLLEEMRRRPGDPWPRGEGHAPLGGFQSAAAMRAYLEPGGGFSPSFASFGVAIWVLDAHGTPLATSDDIAADQIVQRYVRSPANLPGVTVQTPYYHALWSLMPDGAWRLDLRPRGEARLALVVRSPGPAGGPVRTLAVDDQVLTLNGRWRLALSPARQIVLGDERRSGWTARTSSDARAESRAGWAFARIDLAPGPATMTLKDRDAPAPQPLPRADRPYLEGFPPAFVARLTSQRETLLLGLTEGETRPGDPIHYPLSWQRDGAYEIVALARSGHAPVAAQLVRKFAEEDFFGGFGAEADAPGLSIWAIGETARALGDPVFDAAVWPHVRRKAELIGALTAAPAPVRRAYTGPVAPEYAGRDDLDLVADPAQSGLIAGRMDWHRPVFFVNAVSALGLLEAAKLADRSGAAAEAGRFRAQAEGLAGRYRARFASLPPEDPALMNDRTAISGLWPSAVAEPAALRQLLERRAPQAAPVEGELALWTYFALAEAHQWLWLREPERAERVAAWFDQRDPSRGLATYWEGEGEENDFGGWMEARGWARPSHVTPHYWAVAEGLLLSLDSLAMADPGDTRLVIGAGVPPDWLQRPLVAENIGSASGPVSWRWDGRRQLTVFASTRAPIELGPGFPPDAQVEIRYGRPRDR